MDFEVCTKAPESWARMTIDDVCTRITSGGTPSRRNPEFFINGSVPWVKTQELQDGWIRATEEQITEDAVKKSSAKLLPAKSVLLAMYGATVGQLGVLASPMACNQACCALIVNDEIADFRYVYYLLLQHRAVIKSLATGAAQQNLSAAQIKEFRFAFPDLQAQRQVADVLSGLDDKIALNRRINQTLEAMAQAIFKSWFVDFDPVKAKIAAIQEGRDPLRAAMSAISGKPDAELDTLPPEQYDQLVATAALFPDEMEESELGEIPKGWASGALGEICSFTAGSAFKPEHQGSTDGDYPFIKVSDMNLAGNEVFIQSANNYVSKAQQFEMKAKLHPLGATVFAKIGVALISNRRRLLNSPTIIDNNLMSASSVEAKSGQYFLYSLLRTLDFNTLISGTALPYINVSDLKKIPIVRPRYDACSAFEAKASSIFSMMQTLAAQSSTLAITRDALLPKLLLGEIEASGKIES